MTELLSSLGGAFQFSSGPYLVLLAAAVIVYFLLPGPRTRAAWLLFVSAAFYQLLSPLSLFILLAVAALSYFMGWLLASIPRSRTPGRRGPRRSILILSVVLMVGTLVVFKYLGFFTLLSDEGLRIAGLGASIPFLRLALPLGISFWIFQSIAYVVDVYRGRTDAIRNPFYFLLAVMYFPIVAAGPITRVQALVARFKVEHHFSYDDMQSGLLLIGRGFFKKLLIADRLVVFVDTVYNHPYRYAPHSNSSILLVASVFFAIQVYCDFSAYTDIVRGSSRLFGVELPINFRAPYFSRSVRIFWRRWHMTLMDWFREYVYIPMGGSQAGEVRHYVNLIVVFALSGLWHGAGLTYLAWGVLNGAYVVVDEVFASSRDRFVAWLRIDPESLGHRIFQTVLTFLLITVAWVFFRSGTLTEAFYIVRTMFVPTPWVFTDGALFAQGLTGPELLVALVATVAVFASEWVSLRMDLLGALRNQSIAYRWTAYYALIIAIVVFGAYGGTYNAADFIYFKY